MVDSAAGWGFATGMNARVRAASIDDVPAIAQIHVDSWRAAYRGLMPDAVLDGLSVAQRMKNWDEWIRTPLSPEHRVWVIDRDSQILGFASTGLSRDKDARAGDYEVYAIYLDPGAVGQGLGAMLFAHSIDELRARGAGDITLWALEGNDRATRFYERQGMIAEAKKIETVRGAELPHVRYRLSIAPHER
jgi:GNAT superfamily N-acetyltransferase